MKFQLDRSLRGVPDEDVLADLRRCAEKLGRNTLTISEYEEHGHAHPSMVQRRFGSWTRALELADLEQSRSKIGISDVELFENLRRVWLKLGRQPRYAEVKKPLSNYSSGTYEKRFGDGGNHWKPLSRGSTQRIFYPTTGSRHHYGRLRSSL